MKQRVWQPQHCDPMCLLLRVYCVDVSMATVCVYRQTVWISSNTKKPVCLNVCVLRKESQTGNQCVMNVTE